MQFVTVDDNVAMIEYVDYSAPDTPGSTTT